MNGNYADARLPDLAALFDMAEMGRLFQMRLSGVVTSCKTQDVKYQPGRRCVVTYMLLMEPGPVSGAASQTIGVAEATPEGLAYRLFDDDPILPWLAQAADATQMGDRIASSVDGMDRVEACAVTPVRYKPGLRCVFRYDVRTAHGLQIFFGKMLAEGGEELTATINSLYDVSERMQAMPGVVPVLAYWGDLRMMLQPSVREGIELNSLAFDGNQDSAVRERWIHEAGVCLGALHNCEEVEGPRRTLQDDMQELAEYVPLIEQADRGLARSFRRAMGKIEELARDQEESQPAAGHGAFRTDQFLIEGGRLVMIDLDGFCRANPARDPGNFLAYLDWKEIRQPQHASFMERARLAFLAGYDEQRGAHDHGWVAIYRAASLLKIAGRRYRSLSFRELPLVPRLVEMAGGEGSGVRS